MHRPARQSCPAALGMSLLEVMLAMSILAVGLLAAISQFSILRGTRQMASDNTIAANVANAIAERLIGMRSELIGTSSAPWSAARTEPNTGDANPTLPLIDDTDGPGFLPDGPDDPVTGRSARGLQTLGLYPQATGLANLRVYIEYYRAVNAIRDDGTADPTRPGLMDEEDYTYTGGTADFRTRFYFDIPQADIPTTALPGIVTNRTNYRLDPAQPPFSSVGQYDPVAIRIFLTWGNRQHLSLITARSP